MTQDKFVDELLERANVKWDNERILKQVAVKLFKDRNKLDDAVEMLDNSVLVSYEEFASNYVSDERLEEIFEFVLGEDRYKEVGSIDDLSKDELKDFIEEVRYYLENDYFSPVLYSDSTQCVVVIED